MTENENTLVGLDLGLLRRVVAEGPIPLFATISGAHLYGFPSADSDVDLRGAHVLPLREVLALKAPSETLTISRQEGALDLDWVAHDLLKFARLMIKRNGYVLEQLYSPLVVHGGPWLEELRALGRGCMVSQLFFHYRGFLHTQRKELEKRPTVKALLYAYRVVLSGIHVLRCGEIEAHLDTLLGAVPLAGLPLDSIRELISRKQEGNEKNPLSAEELAAHLPTLERLEEALNENHEASSLPSEYTGLDALSDYVVRARLELGQ